MSGSRLSLRRAASTLALLLLSALADGSARAEILTSTLTLGMRFDIRCLVLTSGVGFPTYGGSEVTAQGSVTVDCNIGRTVMVRLGEGTNAAPGSTPRDPLRRMTNGTDFVEYNLYRDAALTQVWSDARPGVSAGRTLPVNIPVYGMVPGGQDIPNGLYQDVVVVTMTY